MLFQAPPPPEAPPPAQTRVVRQDGSAAIVAELNRPLLVQKPPAAENLIVRQRLILRYSLVERATLQPDSSERYECRWDIASYVQRDMCFTSLTGLTGCTASVSDKLAQEASGAFDTTPPPDDAPPAAEPAAPKVCDFTSGQLAAAVADANARLSDRSAALFESDYATQVRPLLTRPGVTLKPR